jgi:hypothetical protein
MAERLPPTGKVALKRGKISLTAARRQSWIIVSCVSYLFFE